eukprot:comp17660_c1_seq1/m.17452 comp17660_c1_seq1/g.17452  ORF comp17660_c1_seq1/g.17452 comp17660_c1_seq1/m.17452 type:complete len:444 (-) comp17660_c1_seq1:27-1358(-)
MATRLPRLLHTSVSKLTQNYAARSLYTATASAARPTAATSFHVNAHPQHAVPMAGAVAVQCRHFWGGFARRQQSNTPFIELEEMKSAKQQLERHNPRRALQDLHRALEVARPLGPSHPLTTEVNRLTGMVYAMLGDYRHGTKHLEQYFTRTEAPNKRPIDWALYKVKPEGDGLVALNLLVECYTHTGQIKDALAAAREVYRLQTEKGAVSTEGMQAALRLAELLYKGGHDAEGSKLLAQAREDQAVLSEKDPLAGITMAIFTAEAISNAQGNTKAALKVLQGAFDTAEKALEEKKFSEPTDEAELREVKFFCLRDMASCYFDLKNFAKTEESLQSALKLVRELYPDTPDHLYAATCLHSLGRAYDKFNKSAIYAEGYYNSALGAYENPIHKHELDSESPVRQAYTDLLKDFSDFLKKHGRGFQATVLDEKLAKYGTPGTPHSH